MYWKRFISRDKIVEKPVVWIILAAVFFLIAGVFIHQTSENVSFYKPEGYFKKVQALVDQAIVTYDRKAGKIVFQEKMASKNVQSFYKQSYLEADIKAFNEGNFLGSFNIKDGKIQLDKHARSVKLPFTAIPHWTGDLFYRDSGNTAMLENDRLHLQLSPAPRNLLPLKAAQYEIIPIQKKGFYSQFGFLLQYDTRKYFAQMEYIGDNVVMGVKQKFPAISVNNYAIPQGNNVRLDDGDIVYFYDRGFKEYLLFKEKASAGLISTIRNVNGSLERIYFSKSFTMARHFGDGLQAVIANTCEGEKDKDFDVTWTIDRKLHSTIQDKLEKFFKLGVKNQAKLQIDPAAVTLIDNDTGDILTLASFPDASVLDSSTSELQRKGKRQGYIDRLSLNQNLLNHPIGSAGKPFLATAIWTVHPYLSEFSIIKHPPGNEIKNTLGLSLDKPFEIFSHRENVIDRRAFLHYSCNLYMVNLFLLGLASDFTEDQKFGYTFESIPLEYEVGGVGISNGIDFSQYLKQPSNTFVNLESSPIARALNSIFDIEIQVVDSNDVHENTAAGYDTQLLEPISNTLFIRDKFQLKPLFSSCPEQVNLRFNHIQLLRSEFISLDLGGASSEWNNIKLAESVARIVTGKKVKARLIKDISGKNVVQSEAKSLPSFPLFEPEVETALQWVREGMELVATDGGTAQALAPHIKRINDRLMNQDLRIVFYSKTGSPRKKDVGPNSAVYIFSVILEKKNGDFWATMNGISGSIYIESRGLSALAVAFAGRILDDIVNYLYSQYELNL